MKSFLGKCAGGEGFVEHGVMVCGSFSDILREAWAIRARCQRDPAYADCEFFFRGEYQSHHPSGDKSLPSLPGNAIASIFRPWNQTLLKNEHIMLNEAVRWYPNFVSPDLPTLELLSRMRHYFLPTRLLDVSLDLRFSTAMAVNPGDADRADAKDVPGFLYVYAIRRDRIKYTDSDTAAAIAAMARRRPEEIVFDGDLGFLLHAVRAERPGFAIMEGTRDQLVADLQHLWCIKPLLTTEHVRAQSGCFILFGNKEGKVALEPTYSREDFDDPRAPSYGIEQVGTIFIDGPSKGHIRDELEMIGMAEYQYYPEFTTFATAFQRQLNTKGKQHG